jgi:ABC-type uncharacterized transport system involved in gliding motility auxiliary subunit
MSTRTQTRYGASTLVLIAVAFIVATMVSNQLFKGARIDLTENQLYTLSDGTKRILKNIDEPINLYFFYSDQATASAPSLRDYANRVREMLTEFAAASRGKIRLNVIDPVPFSEEEDQAAQFGLQEVRLGATPDPVYLGLAGTNSVGDEEIISFFQPDREATLEYDLAKLVSTLAEPERKTIGLLSGVSMSSEFDPQAQRVQPAWVAYQQAGQMFEIRDLGTSLEAVPADIGLLWIVQPKDLDDATQYAIDQFVMQGGKALIFVDPLAVIDAVASEGMPPGMPPMGQASDLPVLFKGWGIGFDATQVVADAQLALQINTGFGNRPSRHYGYLGISSEQMNSSDIVTADLSTINAAMPGRITLAEGSAATLEPLLTSSAASSMMPASRFTLFPDPSSLQHGFVASGESQVIAARIGGTLPSAFPDRNGETHLAESTEPVNLVVVADVDMLSDHLWVQVQNFFGQQVANAFASNGAFVINALENLAGSSDLIAVRSRGTFARPFTKVDELRVDAEARFRATEQRLQQELAETERRLGELQSTREDTGSLLLTSEQQSEIDRFVDQRASIRKELRAVQRGLDKDIEDLGTTLKIINIGLVPLLLTIATLLALWRRRRVPA